MNNFRNTTGTSLPAQLLSEGIHGRILRSMSLATVTAVIAGLFLAPWRITAGLFLGGILTLFNHHWLSGSATAALSVVAQGAKPRIGLAQYVLRYAVVTGVVFAAYTLNLVSLVATIIGLSSFVVALFVEAVREFYLAVIHREEIS